MNVEYKRENHKSYLVLKDQNIEKQMEKEDKEGYYGVKMLCDNPIKGLLPLSLHVFNGEKELYYDISTRQPLNVLYEKKEMKKEDLERLFSGMKEALRNLEEYLLDTERLVIKPEYIYIHSADESINLLFDPCERGEFEKEVYDFAEYLLERINNEDEQAVVYAYGFYRYIKEEQGDLSEALERLLGEKEIIQDEAATESPGEESRDFGDKWNDLDFYADEEDAPVTREPEKGDEKKKYDQIMRMTFFMVLGLGGIGILAYSVWKYHLNWENLFSQRESIVGAGIFAVSAAGAALFHLMDLLQKKQLEKAVEPSNEKEEEVFIEKALTEVSYEEVAEEVLSTKAAEESFYETVLLQENCYQEQRILTGRIRGKQKQIDLSSFPFIIGKSKEQSDYVLEDSSVSRIHARFTLRDDIVYLTDLNSTNGTCKNGIRLEPNELVMLEADDEITFGRLTFTYH